MADTPGCIHTLESGTREYPTGKCSLQPYVHHHSYCQSKRFATHNNTVKCNCGLTEALTDAN